MKKYLLFTLCGILSLGCAKNSISIVNPIDFDEICIKATYPVTKVTATDFESGDQIGLYAVEYDGDAASNLQIGGNYLNNECMKYDGVQWKGVRPVYWSSKPCDFYALYPYQQVTSIASQIFNIQLDQSTAEGEGKLSGYEASDFLWAKAVKTSRTDGEVVLNFKHLMSKVNIKILKGKTYEGELPKDIDVHIYNTITSANVNLLKGSLEKNPYGVREPIKACPLGPDIFTAIVVPQNIPRRSPLIEVTMGGISYLLSYSMSFHPGREYLISVIVNKSPEQEKIEISIDGEVQPWN